MMIGSVILLSLMRALAALPLRFHYACAGFFSWLLKDVLRYRRDVVMANLSRSFPEKKYDELTQEDKDQKAEAEKAVQEQKDKKQQVLADYAKGNSIVHQLIDLALLQNGMLKGEALDKFLKRSVDLIK